MSNKSIPSLSKTVLSVTLGLSIALAGNGVMPQPKAHAASASVTNKLISSGKKYLGVRYQFGASSNTTRAFDCSSFTQRVFKLNGVKLPRSSKQQAKAGTYISKRNLKAGDLVFSDTNRDGIINHVSIYIGNDRLMHTYRVGVGVTISKFSGSAWDRTYKTARRVI
ncbi:cell wall-associated hydrolase [Paenibacillus swuensis]|uniref:Cell wall-associated hydrolase n=1 Tax=Paenibacillus swuensis TaxID=1178515 RepID=A0A172TN49_9BACL|nr:C40 family peptidase [Paenibacillus swuensis]ANE48402.1 cell wall-associated hydrolase [Paenibacillus swuensis]